MSKLLESDSDSEPEIRLDNDFAKNYDNWRRKEELNKLKTKYGDETLELNEESSSSSEDDEDGVEWTEEVEKDFFKTLACLKRKDPRIYDEKVNFFNTESNETETKKKQKKKEKPMTIKDYERQLILEKGGQLSDEDEGGENRSYSPTYVEEQEKLKEMFKNVQNFDENEDDNDDPTGGMFKARQKTKEEQVKEEEDYKQWLAGKKDKVDDKEAEKELKPLKDYWNNPNLDDGEKFLRNYILNQDYLKKEDEDYIPTYQEIIHDSDPEDLETVEKQEEFEHKYNFRFEEPDQEFIKRYPRTVPNSLRKTDDKRKLKRQETKERKQKEKEQKMQELKKLQELKRKEIEEKIEKLKEITGNDNIGFNDDDLEGDFDPEEHDRKMQQLFNDEFYQAAEDDEKPEFPDMDEELEIERWDKYYGDEQKGEGDYEPHCEDDDFIMDADYDPTASTQQELIENSKRKKKRKRKSLFAKTLKEPKPVFDSNDKTYEQYLDEYYKLDCEDIIGDIPCRFKYRQVMPNDFGLTIEEILMAKDRELNKWCSLKKAVQIRPDHVEKYDQIAFQKKAQNIALKKRILPSLFEEPEEEMKKEDETSPPVLSNNEGKSKKKRKAKTEPDVKEEPKEVEIKEEEETLPQVSQVNEDKPKKKKKMKAEIKVEEKNQETIDDQVAIPTEKAENKNVAKKKKKNKKKKQQNQEQLNSDTKKQKRKISEKSEEGPKRKKQKKNQQTADIGISDARLSAYGLNPKKFKNKLKYKNK